MTSQVYLLDIEGTTTPIDFVTRQLFPYARRMMPEFVAKSLEDPEKRLALIADCCLLAEEHAKESGAPAWPNAPDPSSAVPYLQWLIDQDRKTTGLKNVQGRVWEEGYTSGALKGEVYPDVWPAVKGWKEAGAKIAIFSSGSVLAQKLIFSHLPEGDMTPLISAYFDTTTGSKREPDSYRKIAEALGVVPADVHFLSDIVQEVEAARDSGMRSTLVDRTGAEGQPSAVHSFEEIE